MADFSSVQIVTFNLGNELYGVEIMNVEGIVSNQEIRQIPNAPPFVEGIFNLRGDILPVINLHKKFHLEKMETDEADNLFSGLIIIKVVNMKLAVIIDKIASVLTISKNKIQPPPQIIKGIGSEYIRGVTSVAEKYIILLDVERLFAMEELAQIESLNN